jgi:hypothetical protein
MSEESNLTASQRAMAELWDEHTAYEFEDHSAEKTLQTMTDDPVNINVPLLTGGVGLEEVRKYYSEYFIPKNPRTPRLLSSRAPWAGPRFRALRAAHRARQAGQVRVVG